MSNQIMTMLNDGYINSKVNIRMDLVHTHVTPYISQGNDGADLDGIAFGNQPEFTQIRALRDQYGADLVAMLVSSSGYGGIGYVFQGFPGSDQIGYSVSDISILSYLVVNHELGHNMGMAHDYDNSDPNFQTFRPKSYGYKNCGSQPFTTIMSYECTNVPSFPKNVHSSTTNTFEGRQLHDDVSQNP